MLWPYVTSPGKGTPPRGPGAHVSGSSFSRCETVRFLRDPQVVELAQRHMLGK